MVGNVHLFTYSKKAAKFEKKTSILFNILSSVKNIWKIFQIFVAKGQIIL